MRHSQSGEQGITPSFSARWSAAAAATCSALADLPRALLYVEAAERFILTPMLQLWARQAVCPDCRADFKRVLQATSTSTMRWQQR